MTGTHRKWKKTKIKKLPRLVHSGGRRVRPVYVQTACETPCMPVPAIRTAVGVCELDSAGARRRNDYGVSRVARAERSGGRGKPHVVRSRRVCITISVCCCADALFRHFKTVSKQRGFVNVRVLSNEIRNVTTGRWMIVILCKCVEGFCTIFIYACVLYTYLFIYLNGRVRSVA